MRNIFYNFLAILLAFIFAGNLTAQTPEQLSYQAIVRNSNDQLVSNKTIGLKVTILKGSESGEVVYQEILSPTTNVNGLLNIKIGSQAGFSTIDWANGPYFIKTEVDIEGNGNYTITTVAQILSVPYAKHAETVNRLLTISNEECGTTNRGAIRYDEDNNNLVFCNGSNWVAVGSRNATNLTPALTTLPAIDASNTSARLMASSVDKNAIVVLKKGFVWATTPMPTLDNNVIDVNASFDEYSEVVSNLHPNTTYYVRSFAVNLNGVGYGNEVSFTTLADVSVKNVTKTNGVFSVECLVQGGSGSSILERGVLYNTSKQLLASLVGTKVTAVDFDAHSFIVQINQSGLLYAIPYVRNEIGISYGSTVLTLDGLGLETQPELPNPPAGKVTLAIRVPEGTCNGVVLTGSPFGWSPASGTAAFTKVAGTETWYSVTFDYATGDMLKAIAVPETGTANWKTQWENIEILEGDAEIEIQNATEPGLVLVETSDGTVIYVTIGNWITDPCAPPVPGGTGTFTFTPACELPENAVVIFTGNFDEKSWAESDRNMTRQSDGSYTWTGDYPVNFEMKVFVDDVYWMTGQNVVFDGTTFSFTGTGDFCPVP